MRLSDFKIFASLSTVEEICVEYDTREVELDEEEFYEIMGEARHHDKLADITDNSFVIETIDEDGYDYYITVTKRPRVTVDEFLTKYGDLILPVLKRLADL